MRRTHYGWKRDSEDRRDFKLSLPTRATLPAKVDLRPELKDLVFDQLTANSCTGNAIANLFDADRIKQGLAPMRPSRLFIYYNERDREGATAVDDGAMIRDGMKSIAKDGVCPESEWPYDLARVLERPSPQCYADALKNHALKYMRVGRTETSMRECAAAGLPFVYGITVYSSFESDVVANTGVVPMPKRGEEDLGGHALLDVGYDYSTKTKVRIGMNSWGTSWGDHGFFYIPVAYLNSRKLASDLWTLSSVSGS